MKGFLLAINSFNFHTKEDFVLKNGIVSSHSYSILDVIELHYMENTDKWEIVSYANTCGCCRNYFVQKDTKEVKNWIYSMLMNKNKD